MIAPALPWPTDLDALADDAELCERCGEPLYVDVLEVWGHEFQLAACCEWVHQEAVEYLREAWTPAPAADRKQARKNERAARDAAAAFFAVTTGLELRQVDVEPELGGWVVDYGLRVLPVDQDTARAFIDQHHRHNPSLPGWLTGFGIFNGPTLVGVCWVGQPAARGWDASQVCEVRRLCVHPGLERALVWNACSLAYGEAARWAQAQGYRVAITYTLADEEPGTSLRAAGWVWVDPQGNPTERDRGKKGSRVKGRSWNTATRPREDKAPTCDKRRWGRILQAAPAAKVAA